MDVSEVSGAGPRRPPDAVSSFGAAVWAVLMVSFAGYAKGPSVVPASIAGLLSVASIGLAGIAVARGPREYRWLAIPSAAAVVYVWFSLFCAASMAAASL